MAKRWWLVSVALAAGLGLFFVSSPAFLARAQSDPVHAHTWNLSPDQFYVQEDFYLSPVQRAPFSFTAAAVHLRAAGIAGAFADVALRLRAEGREWSPWYALEEWTPEADGRLYGDNLVAWSEAREVQVRVRGAVPLSEVFQDLAVVAIDAQAGPTAAQAAAAAQARATAESALAQRQAGVSQPTVIRRAEWGADERWMSWTPRYAPIDKIILHHTVTSGGNDPAAEVRAIYYYHAVTRGWGDIGYNFLVDKFGNIYEGRYGGPDVVGGHVSYWNDGSMGVSVLGCYDNGACPTPQVPAGATLAAVADLVAWASNRRGLDPRAFQTFDNPHGYAPVSTYVLAGHRDYAATTCPGGNLYAELPNLRQMAWERWPQYAVRFGEHDTPGALDAGAQATVYLNLYNEGRGTWSDADGVRLGYRWMREGQVVGEHTAAARIIPGAVVLPGEMTALVAQLAAPLQPGFYTLRWDLYRDGVGWFAEEPLDIALTIRPVLGLDVGLEPPFADAGAAFSVEMSLQGAAGQAFEARTRLPAGVGYVNDSAQSQVGSLYVAADEVIWSGALDATTAQARFDVRVSTEETLALSTCTTLQSPGYAPLVVERWLIVNGYWIRLPFAILSRP